jgi:N-acetylmuramoyl-L-alanine amidase
VLLVSFAFVKPITKTTKQINVVIDAGHGGTDLEQLLVQVLKN